MSEQKTQPTEWQTVKRLFTYLMPYKGTLILCLAAAVISTYLQVVAPLIMAAILNHVQEVLTMGQAINLQYIFKEAILLALCYIVQAVTDIFTQRSLVELSQSLVRELHTKSSEKIRKVPLSYFDSHQTGDILSRVTNDIQTIGSNVQSSVSQIFSSLLMLAGILIMMVRLSWKLSLIFFLTMPLNFIATRLITNKSHYYFTAKSEGLGDLVSYVEEDFTGSDLIKAFGQEEESEKAFREKNNHVYEVSYRASFMSGILLPIMTFIGNIDYVLLALFGGIFVVQGKMMIGDVLAFLQYSEKIRNPLNVVAEMANNLQETIASANRVFEFLDAPEEVECHDNRIEAPIEEIRFNHVDFSYEKDKPVIRDLNLTVNNGETVAIVGHTGAGKTTLVNLLLRFYDVSDGSITVNGTDIRTVPRDNLRSFFGMVLQDTWLIEGTIYDNIKYGNISATRDEVIQASKEAHAHSFIETLPDGYDTVLKEDGSNISQGQRQLITIARAFVKNPDILVLDEATSSVDTRTEQQIQSGMANLMEGRTNFVIAHRLSTIVDANTILVMDHGNIVEQGNHQELMAQHGVYYDLYQSQFQE